MTRRSELNLKGTNVTDRIIPYVEKMSLFLSEIDLVRTKVTAARLDRLSREKPNLSIYYSEDGEIRHMPVVRGGAGLPIPGDGRVALP